MRPVTSFCLHHDADTLGVVPTHHSGGHGGYERAGPWNLTSHCGLCLEQGEVFLGPSGTKSEDCFLCLNVQGSADLTPELFLPLVLPFPCSLPQPACGPHCVPDPRFLNKHGLLPHISSLRELGP